MHEVYCITQRHIARHSLIRFEQQQQQQRQQQMQEKHILDSYHIQFLWENSCCYAKYYDTNVRLCVCTTTWEQISELCDVMQYTHCPIGATSTHPMKRRTLQ